MIKFISNVEDFKRAVMRIEGLGKKMHGAVYEEIVGGVHKIRNWIITEMYQGAKTGRRYRRTKTKDIYHTASAPGEVPAVDSSKLVSSIDIDVRSDEIEVGVVGDLPYAVHLEEGTEKMAKRPFLEPALDAETPGIEKDVLRAIEKSAEEAFRK